MGSGLILNDDVHWIVFHGGFDLAYLLKLAHFDNLPVRDTQFQEQLKLYFPNVWDVKYMLSKINSSKTWSLNRIVNEAGIERKGPKH